METVPAWHDRHLLDVDTLTLEQLELIVGLAGRMAASRDSGEAPRVLAGRQLTTLFYEASTRTRVSFEVAAQALGAEVVTVQVALSSVTKGETLVDTVRTLEALGTELLVMRHARSGAAYLAARHVTGSVLNAGDGWHAHPTQALVDLYTLTLRLPGGNLTPSAAGGLAPSQARSVGGAGPAARAGTVTVLAGRKVAIVGDVLRSRVARSDIWALTACGVDLWLCAPRALLGGFEAWARAVPADRRLTVTDDLDAALRDADAVMALRMQRERDAGPGLPSPGDYAARYALTSGRLRAAARPDVVVMHPGPVNEGVEITAEVARGPSSAILDQVRNGVPIRMAVLALVAGAPRA